jgi:hypothetical protein
MTPNEFYALQKLADVPRGIAKTLMIAYGFTHELIVDLVQSGLVNGCARYGEDWGTDDRC